MVDVEVPFAKDGNIIKMHHDEPSDVWSNDVHMYPLESNSCIAQSKGHHKYANVPPWFVNVIFRNISM